MGFSARPMYLQVPLTIDCRIRCSRTLSIIPTVGAWYGAGIGGQLRHDDGWAELYAPAGPAHPCPPRRCPDDAPSGPLHPHAQPLFHDRTGLRILTRSGLPQPRKKRETTRGSSPFFKTVPAALSRATAPTSRRSSESGNRAPGHSRRYGASRRPRRPRRAAAASIWAGGSSSRCCERYGTRTRAA